MDPSSACEPGCLKSSWLPHLFLIQFCQFEIKCYFNDISVPPIYFADQRPETYPKDICPQRLIPDITIESTEFENPFYFKQHMFPFQAVYQG